MTTDFDTRVAERLRAWQISPAGKFTTATAAIVYGTRAGVPIVLKVVRTPGDEWRSGEVVAAFGGRGVVRVYEHVEGALLLESLTPGEPLAALSLSGRDDEATEILAALLGRMSPGDPPRSCPSVEDYGLGLGRYSASGDTRIPRRLVEVAQRVYRELAATQRNPGLLHGDLHHYNVLFDERRGWIAIDPKGLVGELEYEIGAALRNPSERPELFASLPVIERRLGVFADALGIDVDRARAWAFAQAVLAAVWDLEEGQRVDQQHWSLQLAGAIEQSSAFRDDFVT
ncbi:MAG TPA: aminoglycoside phosphotransferase family protein [Vicinamibacterales bacterium]|nr:aminoglycoside phosphotransferase family protein [Vicinamibacterales bacterium]